MSLAGIIALVAAGLILVAFAYGLDPFEVLLVGPVLFTFLSVTVALIVVVVASRRRRSRPIP
jgi:hypothetical protein